MARLSRKNDAQLEALVDGLDLTLEIPICLACLSFVSMALDGGDERDIRSTVRFFAPALWDDGLAEPALAALGRAVAAEVPGAAEALADVRRRGGRSEVVRRIVLRLGALLSAESRRRAALFDVARPRLEAVRPELN